MNNEIRLSYRKVLAILISLLILFVYILNKKSCESAVQIDSSESQGLPTIYAVTPTYYRPVQKAELTR